ncbi:MAG: hypothetical protein PVF13_02220 [Chromatiales bacterium]|jgi:hypothetical protein
MFNIGKIKSMIPDIIRSVKLIRPGRSVDELRWSSDFVLDDSSHPKDIANRGELTMQERRNSVSPVPADPKLYINELQVNGLIILKKFGWRLVCIRRYHDLLPSVILKNRNEERVGVLQHDGILKLREDLKIRTLADNDVDMSEQITKAILLKLGQHSHTGWLEEKHSITLKSPFT